MIYLLLPFVVYYENYNRKLQLSMISVVQDALETVKGT